MGLSEKRRHLATTNAERQTESADLCQVSYSGMDPTHSQHEEREFLKSKTLSSSS